MTAPVAVLALHAAGALRGAQSASVGGDVPVVPDADRARDWLERELAGSVYHQRPSLLRRLLDWLGSLFDGLPGLPVDAWVAAAVVAVVLVALALVALRVSGPVRRSRRLRTPGAVLDAADRRSASGLRADADAAAARGDWASAVADRFRAIVRALEERVVLDERPGRTAHEAVDAAVHRLPDATQDLRRAAALFDDVVYGGRRTGPDADAWLREVDARVAALRPLPVGGRLSPERVP